MKGDFATIYAFCPGDDNGFLTRSVYQFCNLPEPIYLYRAVDHDNTSNTQKFLCFIRFFIAEFACDN
jgi:hypothetical protein